MILENAHAIYIENFIFAFFQIVKFMYLWALFSLIVNILYAVQYFGKCSIEDGIN
ncbi:hypothetical protein N8865_02060 [Francisellaceae bacterium]|nr:hypothetical protein [Francisellaceae bacterium]